MYRPNRVGPHILIDVETTPYQPADALLAAANTNWPLAPKCVMRSVAPREMDANSYVLYQTVGSAGAGEPIKSMAIGSLLTGETDGQKNKNYIHTVSGHITILPGGLDWCIAQPIMARLDGAPTSTTVVAPPEYDPTTITRWYPLASQVTHHPSAGILSASIEANATQGIINGLVAEPDVYAIFVGWHLIFHNTSGGNKFLNGEASIGIHKWLTSDIPTGDPAK